MRAYSQKELSLLAAQVKAKNYVWQIGEQSGRLAPVTFLIGYPAPADAITQTELTSIELGLVQ
jgi:hypothetical protein